MELYVRGYHKQRRPPPINVSTEEQLTSTADMGLLYYKSTDLLCPVYLLSYWNTEPKPIFATTCVHWMYIITVSVVTYIQMVYIASCQRFYAVDLLVLIKYSFKLKAYNVSCSRPF